MSEYVIVINKGSCYTHVCTDNDRKYKLQCDNGTWEKGATPIEGNTYKKICQNLHPGNSWVSVVTIEDESTGQRYVMGLGGVVPAPNKPSLREYDTSDWWNPHYDIKAEAYVAPKLKQKEKQISMDDNIKIGDLVTVIKQSDSHYGELMKVVLLREYNYDYVTCLPHENTPRWGYNKGQIAKYNIEPDLPEDQKPAFSRSELIEILEQSKPAEEILLDIRDHITN